MLFFKGGDTTTKVKYFQRCRHRLCTPLSKCGDINLIDQRECPRRRYPKAWSAWSSWSSCSCNAENRERSRSCNGRSDLPCYGPYVESGSCPNVDQCIDGTHECSAHEICQFTNPGYTCSCGGGYKNATQSCASANCIG